MIICTESNKAESQSPISLQFHKTTDGGNTWSLFNSPNDDKVVEFGGMSWITLQKG